MGNLEKDKEMVHLEGRLDKLDSDIGKQTELQNRMAITQAEMNVILKEVIAWVKSERSNSGRILILENNWMWAKGICILVCLPLAWLVIDKLMS